VVSERLELGVGTGHEERDGPEAHGSGAGHIRGPNREPNRSAAASARAVTDQGWGVRLMTRRDELLAAAHAIGEDRERGASELGEALGAVLEAARREAPDLLDAIGQIIRSGQPVMVGLQRLVAAAIEDPARAGTWEQARLAAQRAPAALARLASAALADASLCRPLHIVTWSASSSVALALVELAAREPVRVTLGEGRPRGEGTRLAERLRAAGIDVTVLDDGAVTTALVEASAVAIGADAVGPDAFINKAGTLGLTAAAARLGVPVLVVASRDKWCDPLPVIPAGNRLFERIPLDLIHLLVTDASVISPAQLA